MTTRPPMNPRTIAGCFSTYVLPHLLFVDNFADRRKITMTCCLAWNIGLFADAAEREKQIDMVWKMTEADNLGSLGAPPSLEQGVKQDVRMLVDQKRDLFPRLNTLITKASLGRANGRDVLSIETDSGAEEVPLITSPRAAGLPYIIEVLRGIQENTAIQVDLMQQARRTPGALDDIVLTQMDRAYCAQRADLGSYQRMLTVWREEQPAPSVKRVIGHWLDVLDEIETSTQAVLDLIVDGNSQPAGRK